MNKEEIFQLMNANPVFHLATLDGDQPRVRALFLYRADENGIVFHTGKMKDLYKQIEANHKVELCFNDHQQNIQVRVTGQLEQITENAFKDEICEHPTRAFLKPWRASGQLEDFYENFIVYKLSHGSAIWWTMEENFAPKRPVML
ncbi:MAG: pyridoxamine 5'-phosphate oxidase family protein [Desulfatitalea sp.]|nr:pyridoxamine 5'-phosphate oxidase family protein [Desulfatitalea sp.]NNJ99215.1 pyridoxamine 5'-phosphate oxidase family protein [Desulfatitalea sp.]